VYGPGHTSHSLTANAIISAFLKKGIAFIPSPGTYQVCFAYVDDVVHGHVQAMAKGTAGETYILGGNNVSYLQFFGSYPKAVRWKGPHPGRTEASDQSGCVCTGDKPSTHWQQYTFYSTLRGSPFQQLHFFQPKSGKPAWLPHYTTGRSTSANIWFLKNDTHA
jgi:nucleoside-diphosphate-sugar epimerase